MLEDSMEAENTMQSVDLTGECPVLVELDHEEVLVSSPGAAASSCNELFFPNYASSMQSGVPKHLVMLDEKYVLRCLELIRSYALRAEAWRSTSKVHVSPGDLVEGKARRSFDMVRLAKECCPIPGTDDIVKSLGDSAAGGLSTIDFLHSPLLRKFGSIDFDASKPVYSNVVVESLREVNNGSAYKLNKEAMVFDRRYASPPMHRRLVSASRNSSCSDQSSSSVSAVSFQGMLQRTWKDGLPRYVFSVDDKREAYVASLSKPDDKALDYVYTFYSRRKCVRDELEMESAGTMRVSTSISFCRDNSEVRETQFVLSVSVVNAAAEDQASNQPRKKNKGLSRRVVNTFKSSQYYKPAKFQSSSAVLEDIPWDPSEGGLIDPSEAMLSREMAAIIVKEKTKSSREADTGGWGLRFLKKSAIDPSPEPHERGRCNDECSTSMDILIPAGLHGGPRTGPSSLTERWISGGRCDCGGWDTGCPLTILNTRSDAASQGDNDSAQCKSVDLFIKGSKVEVPVLRMVNIHEEGLFYIHFQSTLSSLQSFAIAAAIIHSRSTAALIGHNT